MLVLHFVEDFQLACAHALQDGRGAKNMRGAGRGSIEYQCSMEQLEELQCMLAFVVTGEDVCNLKLVCTDLHVCRALTVCHA